jgi:hypothetical protein
MDVTQWGTDITYNDQYTLVTVKRFKGKAFYEIHLHKDHHIIYMKRDNREIVNFTDTYSKDDPSNLGSFTRFFPKSQKTIIFVNSAVHSVQVAKKVGFIKDKPNPKVLTMDIETQEIKNSLGKLILSPVCISIFNGKICSNFYITDYPSSEIMIKTALKSIMIPEYKNHIVLLHNFSYFDGIFLFRHLAEISPKLETIQKDNRLIDTKVYFGKKQNYISFRDSLLLLPVSLDSLAKSFKVENKGMFPLKILNDSSISLNYVGPFKKDIKY